MFERAANPLYRRAAVSMKIGARASWRQQVAPAEIGRMTVGHGFKQGRSIRTGRIT